MPLTVGLISLGCPKNLIDSEIMIGHMQKAGMAMTPEPELADVMVVNTCAFIDRPSRKPSMPFWTSCAPGRAELIRKTRS